MIKTSIAGCIICLMVMFGCKNEASKSSTSTPEKYLDWATFSSRFEDEMARADQLHGQIKAGGVKDFTCYLFDFRFESNTEAKVQALSKYLTEKHGYKQLKVQQEGTVWSLTGVTSKIPVTAEIVRFWALDMYKLGYENDCRLMKYGLTVGQNTVELPDFKPENAEVFQKQGEAFFQNGNLSAALIHWTLALQVNPNNPNSYYSRAIVKDELYTYKSALADYDKAISLAPDFVGAWINRGALKDENGNHQGALADLSEAIKLSKDDQRYLRMAYFNRGNAKENLKDMAGACTDWNQALTLGESLASEKVNKFCK